ncbi:MAG: diaminopimelate epimerase [Polyangiaceae bacterium]|jgi:diaminopimelate epimerase
MRPPVASAPFAPFEKYEGLGNDFVVVDAANEGEVSSERARDLCDRRRGVGADGVLVMLPASVDGADGRMRVINADGSIAEMCGNGLRCAALHLALRRGLDRGELSIQSDAGVRRCGFERRGDEAVVLADMGVVRVLEDVLVDVEGERVSLTRVDAGNPHAVAFRGATREELERLGPRLSAAPVFERGTNVEFARLENGVLDVLVWERGAGPTLACGTGACAAVAAASAKGIVREDGAVRVRLPGGDLEVRYDRATGRATLRGPARRVYAGKLAGGTV